MEKNHITAFSDFGAFLQSLQADIRSAGHHVHIQFFKYEDDAVGRLIGKELSECVKKGAQVRLLYDDICCAKWRDFYRQLGKDGVETAGFGKVKWPFIRLGDFYRNHRKTVVVDGRIAYLGGMNIAQRYLQGLDWGCWRDTMVRIEGPAATDVQRVFLDDWNGTTRQHVGGTPYFPLKGIEGSPAIEILTIDPLERKYAIMDRTVQILDSARRYVWFESPYLIPTRAVDKALRRAAGRGVDVRILQPPRGDRGETSQWASRKNYSRLLGAGVKIGSYGKGYLHAKTIVSDDRISVVGSCNIDPRSYRLCYEVAAVVDDPSFAATMRDAFLSDQACSNLISPDEWAKRPALHKMQESLASLISSQL